MIFDIIIDNLLTDPLIQSLSNLENKVFSVNPVAGVVEAISKISTDNDINIFQYVDELIIKLAECLNDNRGKVKQEVGK